MLDEPGTNDDLMAKILGTIELAMPDLQLDVIRETLKKVDELKQSNEALRTSLAAVEELNDVYRDKEARVNEAAKRVENEKDQLRTRERDLDVRQGKLDAEELAYKVAFIRRDEAEKRASDIMILMHSLLKNDPASLKHYFDLSGSVPVQSGDYASTHPVNIQGSVETKPTGD